MNPYRERRLPNSAHSLAPYTAPRAPLLKRVLLVIDFWLREAYFWPFLPIGKRFPIGPRGRLEIVNTSVLGAWRDRRIRIGDSKEFVEEAEALINKLYQEGMREKARRERPT